MGHKLSPRISLINKGFRGQSIELKRRRIASYDLFFSHTYLSSIDFEFLSHAGMGKENQRPAGPQGTKRTIYCLLGFRGSDDSIRA